MSLSTTDRNPAPDWARWNYTGYEKKPAYPEFYGFMNTMAQVGRDHGCGRLMWEYDDPTLERYGTPMAPMLVSMFTDGCIGSMEGLYFESSTTTPFHFIDQRELSYKCSCAQRNLPYGGARRRAGRRAPADARRAVTTRPRPRRRRQPADANPDLVPDRAERAVEDLRGQEQRPRRAARQPTRGGDQPQRRASTGCTARATRTRRRSTRRATTITANGPAMTWYTDPTKWDVYLAADGPSNWARVKDGEHAADATGAASRRCANVHEGTDTIDFDVDRTGTPILVKTSYFPSWKVDGAEGPYRVTPNLMVVVPTSNHVHLHYGRRRSTTSPMRSRCSASCSSSSSPACAPLRMPEPPPADRGRARPVPVRSRRIAGRLRASTATDEPVEVDAIGNTL